MSTPLKRLIKSSLGRTNAGRSFILRGYRSLEQAKGLVGGQLLTIAPSQVNNIIDHEFNFGKNGKHGFLGSLLRAGLIRQALATSNTTELETYHRNFWQSENGFRFHDGERHAFEAIFLRHFGNDILSHLTSLLKKSPSISTVCEIGTGTGQLLDYLAATLPQLERLVGIDLSQDMIDDNIQRYNNPKLEFVASGGQEWIEAHGQPNWIFVTNRGVLEYFPQHKLETLFAHISRNLAPAIFVAIEPIAVDHHLATEPNSKPYGKEYSFSHNYPHLFQQAGFDIAYTHHQTYFDHHLYGFVATTAGGLGRS